MPDAITEFMQVDIACYVYLGGNMANSGYDLITPATQLERYIQLRSTLWMLVLYTLEFWVQDNINLTCRKGEHSLAYGAFTQSVLRDVIGRRLGHLKNKKILWYAYTTVTLII